MEDAGEEQNTVVAPSEVAEEAKSNEEGEQKVTAPSREEVLAMRQRVLEGMTEEDIRQLTEEVKSANLTLVMKRARYRSDGRTMEVMKT